MPTIESLERHIGNLEAENRRLREQLDIVKALAEKGALEVPPGEEPVQGVIRQIEELPYKQHGRLIAQLMPSFIDALTDIGEYYIEHKEEVDEWLSE